MGLWELRARMNVSRHPCVHAHEQHPRWLYTRGGQEYGSNLGRAAMTGGDVSESNVGKWQGSCLHLEGSGPRAITRRLSGMLLIAAPTSLCSLALGDGFSGRDMFHTAYS